MKLNDFITKQSKENPFFYNMVMIIILLLVMGIFSVDSTREYLQYIFMTALYSFIPTFLLGIAYIKVHKDDGTNRDKYFLTFTWVFFALLVAIFDIWKLG